MSCCVYSRDSQASFGDTGSVQLEEDSVVDEEPIPFNLPELISASAFDLENFNTLLLNSIENKPLDGTALKGVKNTLLECGSRQETMFTDMFGFIFIVNDKH